MKDTGRHLYFMREVWQEVTENGVKIKTCHFVSHNGDVKLKRGYLKPLRLQKAFTSLVGFINNSHKSLLHIIRKMLKFHIGASQERQPYRYTELSLEHLYISRAFCRQLFMLMDNWLYMIQSCPPLYKWHWHSEQLNKLIVVHRNKSNFVHSRCHSGDRSCFAPKTKVMQVEHCINFT